MHADREREKLIEQNDLLRASLYYMLQVYWDKGDGYIAPDFIQKASKLCNYPLNQNLPEYGREKAKGDMQGNVA